jgi:hypothetical protein
MGGHYGFEVVIPMVLACGISISISEILVMGI